MVRVAIQIKSSVSDMVREAIQIIRSHINHSNQIFGLRYC